MIRNELLKPLEEWLDGAEKIIQMVADTMTTISQNSPLPLSYSMEERRKAGQFISEKTNRMFGILQSNSLRTFGTAKHVAKLTNRINSLDQMKKYQLLPLDNNILDAAADGKLTQETIVTTLALYQQLQTQMQEAHSLLAKIKTSLV